MSDRIVNMDRCIIDIEDNQQFILEELRNGNERAFDVVFNKYYGSLSRFCYSFVKDQDEAENLVQDVFVKLWLKRASLERVENLFSYLMIMVRNQSIDFIRREKSQSKLYQNISFTDAVKTTEEQISRNEFEDQLFQKLHKLPERCRIAFELSRFEGYSNKEIAANMKITVKGVEALIGRSLKFLREELKEYLPSSNFKNSKRNGTYLLSMFLVDFKRFRVKLG